MSNEECQFLLGKDSEVKIVIEKTDGISNSELDAVEQVLGVSFPADLRKFMEQYDGASPPNNSFAISGQGESDVRRFVSARDMASLRNEVEFFPPQAIPIAADSCGNYVYLNPPDGGIYFWDHEVEGGDLLLASNFTEFLLSVAPFDADDVELKPGQVKQSWIDPSLLSDP